MLTVSGKNNHWNRTCASSKSQTAIENRRTTSTFNSGSGSWSNELVIKFGFQLAILHVIHGKKKRKYVVAQAYKQPPKTVSEMALELEEE